MEGRRKIQQVRVTAGWENFSGLAEMTRKENLEYAMQEKEMEVAIKRTLHNVRKLLCARKDK